MSNKGAIKKALNSKNVLNSQSQVKSKTRVSSETTFETQAKLEHKDRKVIQPLDHKETEDRQLRALQSNSIRTSSKVTPRNNVGTSQSKSHQRNLPSNQKSNLANTSRISSQTERNKNTNVRTKSESTRKVIGVKQVDISKSKEKHNAGYSEKRGVSSVYIPKTIASKLSSKSSNQIVPSKTHSSTKDKEKTHSEQISKSRTRYASSERKKSRTLSPSEVKVLHTLANKTDASLKLDSQKIAIKQNSVKNDEVKSEEDDYDYEDDFEDYESDFQECTDSEVSQISEQSDETASISAVEPIEMQTEKQRKLVDSAESRKTEEEHMLDSGHYELAEARKRAARVESIPTSHPKTPPLPELREPVNRAYRQEKQSENKSLPLSTDEGFEDARSGDFTKSPPISQISFIDFNKCKEDKTAKEKPKILNRGEELLQMIKLDIVEFSLLECIPVAYEEFIRNYGKLNTQQMSSQTMDDNLDADVQTEGIRTKNKWTQFPIKCRKKLKNNDDIRMFKTDQVGVGDDESLDLTNLINTPNYDILQLNEFLGQAAKVVLSLLEEKKFGGSVLQNDIHDLPFSEGFVKLSLNSVTFLCDRPVSTIHYSEASNKILLTIHSPIDEGIETSNKQDYITDCCIGCVWSISEPSRPVKIFYSPCLITACCFHSTNFNIVVGGLQDSSIILWDLKEDEMWHQKVTDKANEVDWVIRSPTYTTAGNLQVEGHKSEIVAIRMLSNIERDTNSLELTCNTLIPIQICSLDEEGKLIIWNLNTIETAPEDLGLSYWGHVKLTKSQEICLDPKKEEMYKTFGGFIDMHVDSVDTNNLYLATNSSNILHATCIGNKNNPSVYKQNEMDCSGGTRCIERCPFKQSYFLVGCDNGTVRLHSLNVERPLLQLKDENAMAMVKAVQWSRSKPFTIYVLDVDSKIHIWDLNNSDIFPTYTISTKKWGHISSIQLSPCKMEHDMVNQYLAIGTDGGSVEIHKLKNDFCYTQREEYEQEINTFLRYVAIL